MSTDDDPPVVRLDGIAAALSTEEDFFVHAPLGVRGSVRATVRALAKWQNRYVSIQPAWGRYPHRYGGDYLYVVVGGIRPVPDVS